MHSTLMSLDKVLLTFWKLAMMHLTFLSLNNVLLSIWKLAMMHSSLLSLNKVLLAGLAVGHDAFDHVELGVYEFNDTPIRTLKHNSLEKEHSKCDICWNYFEFNDVLNVHNSINMKKNIQNATFVKKHSCIFHT